MERLKDLCLYQSTKEDLIELIEDYPDLFELSADDLKGLFNEKYLAASYHFDRANKLECEAIAIEKYYKAKYEKNG